MIKPLLLICFFTFLIHLTGALTYSMRLAGLRTRQIAIAMSFVSSSLLISRLSNMFQAPLVGTMVDGTILKASNSALLTLESNFRIIIFAAFLGSVAGAFLTPTMIILFQAAIKKFLHNGSIARTFLAAFKPVNLLKIIQAFRLPRFSSLKNISLKNIPKTFLILNMIVTGVYTIGVLCSLLASAYLPEMRATAINLSGLVNGIATILFTLFVDPPGARITDQAFHKQKTENDVLSVVFYLNMGRIVGTLILAQLFFKPFTVYIIYVTKILSKYFM